MTHLKKLCRYYSPPVNTLRQRHKRKPVPLRKKPDKDKILNVHRRSSAFTWVHRASSSLCRSFSLERRLNTISLQVWVCVETTSAKSLEKLLPLAAHSVLPVAAFLCPGVDFCLVESLRCRCLKCFQPFLTHGTYLPLELYMYCIYINIYICNEIYWSSGFKLLTIYLLQVEPGLFSWTELPEFH